MKLRPRCWQASPSTPSLRPRIPRLLRRRIPRAVRRPPEDLLVRRDDVLHVAQAIVVRVAKRAHLNRAENRRVDGNYVDHVHYGILGLVSALAHIPDAVMVKVVVVWAGVVWAEVAGVADKVALIAIS